MLELLPAARAMPLAAIKRMISRTVDQLMGFLLASFARSQKMRAKAAVVTFLATSSTMSSTLVAISSLALAARARRLSSPSIPKAAMAEIQINGIGGGHGSGARTVASASVGGRKVMRR